MFVCHRTSVLLLISEAVVSVCRNQTVSELLIIEATILGKQLAGSA